MLLPAFLGYFTLYHALLISMEGLHHSEQKKRLSGLGDRWEVKEGNMREGNCSQDVK